MTKEPDVRVSDPKNSIPFPHVAVDTTASSVVEQRGKMHRSVILQASTFTGQENGYLDNVAAAVTGQGGGSGQSGSLTCTCTCACFSVSLYAAPLSNSTLKGCLLSFMFRSQISVCIVVDAAFEFLYGPSWKDISTLNLLA